MFKLLVNSLPKSGTNLLQRCVEFFGFRFSRKSISSANILGSFSFLRMLLRGPVFDRNHVIVGLDVKVALSQRWLERRLKSIPNGKYISSHLNFSEHLLKLLMRNKYKIIHIIRDPRDVLVSHIYYAKREKRHLFHKVYKNLSFDEAIEITLSGGFFSGLYMHSFKSILNDVNGWLEEAKKNKNVLVVRFEELVGEMGGGSATEQLRALNKIARFLDKQIDIHSNIEKINSSIYGKSHTFRKGKVYAWKDELEMPQIKKIESSIGNYIKSFGYDLCDE